MDRIFRIPRVWSNSELKKLGHLFGGHIVNVSGWKDGDKEGQKYQDYFPNKLKYSLTNYKSEARGFQGFENEMFLDLEANLPDELIGKFDVVFNHTVLEHIYKVNKAFENLCLMSKDIVIIVVPFLQKMHANYGDYWRFTPLTVKRMFEDNNLHLQYLTFNSHPFSSVYIFAIGTKNKEKWINQIPFKFDFEDEKKRTSNENFIGVHGIIQPSIKSIFEYSKLLWKKK